MVMKLAFWARLVIKKLKASWPFVSGAYHAFDDPKSIYAEQAFKGSQKSAFQRGWKLGLRARKKFLTPKA